MGRDILHGARDGEPAFGALFVEHNGPSGAVLARGMARDSDRGYSLAVQFSDPLASKSAMLQGAGLRLGKVGGVSLRPVVVAHNAGTVETTVTGRLPFTATDGTPSVVQFPEIRLSPGETKTIKVGAALRAAPVDGDDVAAAGLEFEYAGEPGSVMISALSVSASGNQMFRPPLWDIAAQRSGTGGYPWYIEGDSSTYVHLKNVTAEPQQYTLQMSFEGGVYSGNDIKQPTQTHQQSGEAGSVLKRLSAKVPDVPTFVEAETLELMQQVAKIKSLDAAKLLIKCLAFNYNPGNQDEDRSEDMMIPAIKLLKDYFGESAAPLLYEEGLSTSKGWFRDRIALAVRTILPESGVENFKKKALADVALRPAAFEFHQSLSSEHLDLRLNAPHDRRNAEIERNIEEVKKRNQGGKPR